MHLLKTNNGGLSTLPLLATLFFAASTLAMPKRSDTFRPVEVESSRDGVEARAEPDLEWKKSGKGEWPKWDPNVPMELTVGGDPDGFFTCDNQMAHWEGSNPRSGLSCINIPDAYTYSFKSRGQSKLCLYKAGMCQGDVEVITEDFPCNMVMRGPASSIKVVRKDQTCDFKSSGKEMTILVPPPPRG